MLHRISDALIAFGPAGVFALALLDSIGVPLPSTMDVLLFLVAWKTPNRAWFTAVMAVVGSLIGNVGLFWMARGGGRRFVKVVPDPNRPQRFRKWFDRYGLLSVFIPALVPIPLPLKVFVVSSGVMNTRFARFFGVILLARVVRYFSEAYIGMWLGAGAQQFLLENKWTLVGAALALTLILVAVIKLNDRRGPAM
jgi:membrane protein YqaA with SNARE-associated domain